MLQARYLFPSTDGDGFVGSEPLSGGGGRVQAVGGVPGGGGGGGASEVGAEAGGGSKAPETKLAETSLGGMKTERRRKRLDAMAQLKAGSGLMNDSEIERREEELTDYYLRTRDGQKELSKPGAPVPGTDPEEEGGAIAGASGGAAGPAVEESGGGGMSMRLTTTEKTASRQSPAHVVEDMVQQLQLIFERTLARPRPLVFHSCSQRPVFACRVLQAHLRPTCSPPSRRSGATPSRRPSSRRQPAACSRFPRASRCRSRSAPSASLRRVLR